MPLEPVGEEIDAVRFPALASPIEEIGTNLEIRVVLLPPGELVGSLIELAGSTDCDWLDAELVSGRPNVSCDC